MGPEVSGCARTFLCGSESDGRSLWSARDSGHKHAEVTIDVNSQQDHVTLFMCLGSHTGSFFQTGRAPAERAGLRASLKLQLCLGNRWRVVSYVVPLFDVTSVSGNSFDLKEPKCKILSSLWFRRWPETEAGGENAKLWVANSLAAHFSVVADLRFLSKFLEVAGD